MCSSTYSCFCFLWFLELIYVGTLYGTLGSLRTWNSKDCSSAISLLLSSSKGLSWIPSICRGWRSVPLRNSGVLLCRWKHPVRIISGKLKWSEAKNSLMMLKTLYYFPFLTGKKSECASLLILSLMYLSHTGRFDKY